MILLLPWPPSVNQYWRHALFKTKRGTVARTLLSRQGRMYRNKALATIAKQYPIHEIIRDPVKVEIHLFPPDKRKRDIDNYNKGILDALTYARIWEDDHLVDQLLVKRKEQVPNGSVTLRIERV